VYSVTTVKWDVQIARIILCTVLYSVINSCVLSWWSCMFHWLYFTDAVRGCKYTESCLLFDLCQQPRLLCIVLFAVSLVRRWLSGVEISRFELLKLFLLRFSSVTRLIVLIKCLLVPNSNNNMIERATCLDNPSYAVITIAIRLRSDYDVSGAPVSNSTQALTCQFFVVVVSQSNRMHIVISITSVVVECVVVSSNRNCDIGFSLYQIHGRTQSPTPSPDCAKIFDVRKP